MPSNGNTLPDVILGVLRLNERQQMVATFLAIIAFQGYNNHNDSEDKKLLNRQSLDRSNEININLLQENRDLKKELIRNYDYTHEVVIQKTNKTDSIIQSRKK